MYHIIIILIYIFKLQQNISITILNTAIYIMQKTFYSDKHTARFVPTTNSSDNKEKKNLGKYVH